jgi:exonuclease SbcD
VRSLLTSTLMSGAARMKGSMRILHTADWHLGDRLGRIDRTTELERAVERIGVLCLEHAAEVLLVAGDIFSELSRPDSLRQSIRHLGRVFAPFLKKGGTILALTGNHDNETFCQTLCHMMELASPAASLPGELVPPGRLYLATAPALLRLQSRGGMPVQFVMMPFPTPSRYLEGQRRYQGLAEKNRELRDAFRRRLGQLRALPEFDATMPTVLSAHIHVQSALLPSLFRLTDEESIVFEEGDLPVDWTYVALGHVHRPQSLSDMAHVRYSGSIARMDLGEALDQKSVVLVELGPAGRRSEPALLRLDARPIYEVVVERPAEEIPRLAERCPDASEALVRYHVRYEAGRDVLNDVLAKMDAIFPYWYDRSWSAAQDEALPGRADESPVERMRETVLHYLSRQLDGAENRDELMALAEGLIDEEDGRAQFAPGPNED